MICSSNFHTNICFYRKGERKIFSHNLKFFLLVIHHEKATERWKSLSAFNSKSTLHCERGWRRIFVGFNNEKRIIIFIITSLHTTYTYIHLIQKYLHFLLLWQHLDMLWLVDKILKAHTHVMYPSLRGYQVAQFHE